jgi:lipopolysaccharide export system ATP-binding protein
MALLEARGLVKLYGRRRVVDGVDFTVNAGEVVGLLGSNGAGKTTSFRMVTGLIKPNAGQVFLAGTEVTYWPMYRRARLGMGYLSQETSVFRKLTVEQNLLAILETIPTPAGKNATRYRKAVAIDLLEQFGLVHLKNNMALSLSGGERRRLEIARCLVTSPSLILLDEPFTGIDPKTIADIQDIVRALRAEGIGILLTDHNVAETLRITDRTYVVWQGKVIAHGSPDEIVHNEQVLQVYLGRNFQGPSTTAA